ncbi:hypothetical protein GCM10012286_69400 [Streptomyces lasiicapitis]|uniref:Uncharacterized protein n=1 Tax=Streptomyces lasiicapitis TaxID=1923961 RepID=A0ABQ2MQF4_9ACTN|nr:hypothetical protein GCM10012286_69400 [Streptomyces lasiicapitis]
MRTTRTARHVARAGGLPGYVASGAITFPNLVRVGPRGVRPNPAPSRNQGAAAPWTPAVGLNGLVLKLPQALKEQGGPPRRAK